MFSEDLASILRCGVDPILFIYLGLLVGAKASSKVSWNLVIKRMEKHLARWKGRYLSKVVSSLEKCALESSHLLPVFIFGFK